MFSEYARLGEWNLSIPNGCSKEGECTYPVQDIAIAEIFVHEKYVPRVRLRRKQNFVNDIALIRLSRKVTYTDYIRPICLPPRDLADTYFDGVDLVATGWAWDKPLKGKIISNKY